MLPDKDYIKKLGKESGADLVGIASIDRFGNAPAGSSPTDKLSTCKSVIVFAGIFPKDTLDKDTVTYTAIRNSMVTKLDGIASESLNNLKP